MQWNDTSYIKQSESLANAREDEEGYSIIPWSVFPPSVCRKCRGTSVAALLYFLFTRSNIDNDVDNKQREKK